MTAGEYAPAIDARTSQIFGRADGWKQVHLHRYAGGRPRWSLLASNRVALTGIFALAIVLPEAIHPFIARTYEWAITIGTTDDLGIYATAVALLLAQMTLCHVGITPLVNDKIAILPAFVGSFAISYAIFTVLFRWAGLYHLVTGFSLGLLWHYCVLFVRSRGKAPRIGIVDDAQLDPGLLSHRIEWVYLRQPPAFGSLDAIVFDSGKDHSAQWERFFSRAILRGITVYDRGHLCEMINGRLQLSSRPEFVFGHLFPSKPYLRIKRLIDTACALLALPIILPVIGVTALLIRLESPGPAFFRQKRVGYQGRVFICYKLRSMLHGRAGPDYTTEADPRVTQVGRYIRKYRVDELPQVFNVIRGEMSWIGPRPEAVQLARSYQRSIPFYPYRHTIRPGITGWAAVHQGNVAMEQAASVKLEYDFYYLKYYSFWLDFVVILLTARTILSGFGSR